MRTALIAAVLCSLLSSCGQKGPLFMPDDPAPQSLAAAQAGFSFAHPLPAQNP